MKMRWICIVVVLSGLVSPATAQRPGNQIEEKRAKRVLALGGISFFDNRKPNLTAGGLVQFSFKKWTVDQKTVDSLWVLLNGALMAKVREGPVHDDIRRALKAKFINISISATVQDSSGTWVLISDRDRYRLKMKADSLGVFSTIDTNEIIPPTYYLHLLCSVKLLGQGDHAGVVQMGVMRRNESSRFTAVGLSVQSVIPLKAIGPVIRVEVCDVLGLQVGPAYFFSKKFGYYVSIDWMKGFWRDIGLV